jgi:hypothetical protein
LRRDSRLKLEAILAGSKYKSGDVYGHEDTEVNVANLDKEYIRGGVRVVLNLECGVLRVEQ